MDRIYASVRFKTELFNDVKQGCAGLRLHRVADGKSQYVASVTFWDAMGQFTFETFGTDVPLTIVEELIAEAKTTIEV